MQIVRVFKPQTERKNFFGVGWCSKFRSQTERLLKKFLRERRGKEARKQRKDSSCPQSVLVQVVFVYEEAWEEDFDEHSQQ
jgi:hypothetical protein